MHNKFLQSSGGGGVADPSLVGDRELILIHRVPLNIQSNSSIEQGLDEYSGSNSSIGRTGGKHYNSFMDCPTDTTSDG